MLLNYSIAFIAAAIIASVRARTQSVAVRGQLLCGTKPATDVKLKLYEIDTLTADDFMGKNQTDRNGFFYIAGSESEWGTIDVDLNIYHKCDLTIPLCSRKWKFRLPSSAISKGSSPTKVFDIGTWNLQLKIKDDESRDCVNRKHETKNWAYKQLIINA